VMAHVFSPIINSKEVSAIRGRLELINHLIDDFGFGKSSTISMQLVMGFVRPHLDATDEKVRRAAVEVTVNCYKHKGERTLKYITNVKPALLKLLEARFAELQKPAKGSRKLARSAQGLPAVRGNPRLRAGAPKRDSNSQPCIGSNQNQSFFSQPSSHDRNPEELEHVLKDCSQLFSMGSTMAMSPLSNSAISAISVQQEPTSLASNLMMSESEQEPSYMSESQQDPHLIGKPVSMGGVLPGSLNQMDHMDLDADLMEEIESY